jgi:hypothetical protein
MPLPLLLLLLLLLLLVRMRRMVLRHRRAQPSGIF